MRTSVLSSRLSFMCGTPLGVSVFAFVSVRSSAHSKTIKFSMICGVSTVSSVLLASHHSKICSRGLSSLPMRESSA